MMELDWLNNTYDCADNIFVNEQNRSVSDCNCHTWKFYFHNIDDMAKVGVETGGARRETLEVRCQTLRCQTFRLSDVRCQTGDVKLQTQLTLQIYKLTMQAIIFAAGASKRLRPLTDTTPKCLLKLEIKIFLREQLRML